MINTPTYYVAETRCFAQVTDPKLWVRTKATSVRGAQRLATRRARGVTFTVRVAVENAAGEFETIASLDDTQAITRRRPTWHVHKR